MGQPIARDPEPAPSSSPNPVTPAPALKLPRAKRKYGISLYHAWCKKCSICGEFCPAEALINDEVGTPIVADEDKCNGCMQCVHRCPDFCVEVYERTAPPADGTGTGGHDGEAG
jgi:2-oxoglutarate ferredoxin oxidoreductase subunit delta